MDKFTRLTGAACPIDQTNLNTDQILPARYLKWTRAMGIGKVLFQDLRFDADGKERPDFPINRPAWRNAKIVVGARNFGCGSSREAAVYALFDYGVRCVIAPSYGDIFYSNCFQNGVLPVALPIEEVEQLADEMRASPGNARVTVDLENCQVVSPTGRVIPFKVDARRQHALLNGLDDIAQTMTHKAKVDAWQAHDKNARPWVWL